MVKRARAGSLRFVLLAACAVAAASSAAAQQVRSSKQPYIYRNWQTFDRDDGLPDDHVWTLHVADDALWVGTAAGLARFDGRNWKSWTTADGLPWPVVSAIATQPKTKDLWLGTWGAGLVRLSAGRFDRFDQFNSGLAGDLVFDLVVHEGRIWSANNGGISVFDPAADAWKLHLQRRGDRAETAVLDLWIDTDGDRSIYAGCWCEGLRYLDESTGDWPYVEGAARPAPDELGLLASDANKRPTVSAAAARLPMRFAHAEKTLWWASKSLLYRRKATGKWQSSPIPDAEKRPCRIVHALAARNADEAWLATSDGVHALADWESETWVSYLRCDKTGEGRIVVRRKGETVDTLDGLPTIPHGDVRTVAFQGKDVWLGTVGGLARGVGAERWNELSPQNAPKDDLRHNPQAPCDSNDGIHAIEIPFHDGNADTPGEVLIAAGSAMRPIPLEGDTKRPETWEGYVDMAAVRLAIEGVNARGGYRGHRPFGLVDFPEAYTFARYGWGTIEDEIIHTTRKWGAVGVVQYITPGRRIRSVAAQRIEVPIVNAAETAPTIDEKLSGWIFRPPQNPMTPYANVLKYIKQKHSASRLGILRTPGRAAAGQDCPWDRCMKAAGRSWTADVKLETPEGGWEEVRGALRSADLDAVFMWADAPTSATVLRRLRAAGMDQVFVGSDSIVCREFVEHAGSDPGPVIAAYTPIAYAGQTDAETFAKQVEERFKRPPGPDAYNSFRATLWLLAGIELGGTEPSAVRDALRALSHGGVARLEGDRWHYEPLSRPAP